MSQEQEDEKTCKEVPSPIQEGLYDLAENLSRLEGVFAELQIQLGPVLAPEDVLKEEAERARAAGPLCLVAESLDDFSGRVKVLTNKMVELANRAQL